MSSTSAPLQAAGSGGRGPGRAIRAFLAGIGAVSAKELRGRMRGRRAFAVLTVYLLLLSLFAYGVYAYLRQQSTIQAESLVQGGVLNGTSQLALSADIGHAIFSGLLMVLTLLVLVLAPAFTTGAISLEREKQTIDLLVTTPLSTLGMVIGKLLSALTYVFLLILASVPLMAIVFVFGGVGPDDLVRAYVVLFATAFGMGAIGLFISALTRRTQTATVLTLIVVLGLTLGSAAAHEFWKVLSTETAKTQSGFVPVARSDGAPEALLWLNPFVAGMDLICTTAPGGYDRDTCDYVAAVTGTPFFSTPRSNDCPDGRFCAQPAIMDANAGGFGKAAFDVAVPDLRAVAAVPFPGALGPDADPVAPPVADDIAPGQPLPTFGFPRDTFWPQTAMAFVVVGIILTLLSAQLVAPTRRLRLRRRTGPAGSAWGTLATATPSLGHPTAAGDPPRDPHDAPGLSDEVQP